MKMHSVTVCYMYNTCSSVNFVSAHVIDLMLTFSYFVILINARNVLISDTVVPSGYNLQCAKNGAINHS